MNILYLTNHLNVGGITSYVLSLSSGLKARGHNIFVASSGGELLSEFTREGATFIPIPIKTKSELSPGIFISFVKLLPLIKQYQIEIIHANTRVTQVLGVMLSKYSGRPYLSTCHGYFKISLHRRLFPCWGKKVIAISQQVKDHLADDFRVQDTKIEVVHNGIDVSRFKETLPDGGGGIRQELGLHPGPIIGIVARLSDVKGHRYLLEAMPSVLLRFNDAQLLVIGEGPMQDILTELSMRLGIEKSLKFIPSMDTAQVLSIIDVFVMPSLKEGLGLALMEAMASGIAVVGSNVGGIKSLIQHGQNGLLVEPQDSQAISAAIGELLGDASKRKAFGARAREFIAKNFSLDEMIIKTERVYTQCLEKKE